MNGVPRAISNFYSMIKKFSSRRCKSLEDKSMICELIMKIMRCPDLAKDNINAINRHLGYTSRQYTQEESIGILSSIAVELFTDSNPENRKDDKRVNLGQLNVDLVTYLTSLPTTGSENCLGSLGLSLKYALPILQVGGKIEEMYLDLRKEARLIDTIGSGN